jgi:beta-glucosidase
VPIVRRNSSGAQVGINLNLAQVYPATDTAADRAAADRLIGFQNRWYLDPLYGRGYPSDMLELYGRHDLPPSVEPNDPAIPPTPSARLYVSARRSGP